MKKLIILTGLLLAFSVHAGFDGMGWDNNLGQVKCRLGLGELNVDLGLGLLYIYDQDDMPGLSLSGYLVKPLHTWEKLTGNLAGGVFFNKLPQPDDNLFIEVFLGYQPELIIWDHLLISTRFGVSIPVQPDFEIEIRGDPVSIVEGISFIVLF